ncbi:5-methyltetrahydropteroyltriglutamate--homocysteine S-methyltransferase [Mesobacillus foraminis]|uniref:5-methyltetrahydropteroyltriglutamate-- homocysteine S-methyltransferase n=1 Tax=Mesobacillus foraminis TaxID=279826 RepID=UPI001BE95F33|nr:5-methyltetrahydropteroyltriglutamate--homocysteine S-methyltransferase [Mesobacillus foraminis]MBT2755159.1 5-methyltetrahydropteroyltriglutamate--homocysteine S-methyltransferase [Mesobacillus foraminis]
MGKARSSLLGYPRIGEQREWKKALEQFWAGKMNELEFRDKMEQIRLGHVKKLAEIGIDLIPVGDFSFYDHVLDTSAMFGLVPDRFKYEGGKVSLETYFDIARGNQGAVASEMTKWFNTNYHYIVPELDKDPVLADNRPLHFFREAKEKLNIEGKPVILGPVTFVKLSKGYKRGFKDVVEQFVPLYAQILRELQEEGVKWVQIDEPILSTAISKEEFEIVEDVYHALQESAPKVNILLQTYFDSVEDYQKVITLPVKGIGLDFVHDRGENLKALKRHGFPADKVLAAGVIDGRNIWRANLEDKLLNLEEILQKVHKDSLIIQPSSSLLHVPVTVRNENLPQSLTGTLAFADEKSEEVVLLAKAVNHGKPSIAAKIVEAIVAFQHLNSSTFRNNRQIQEELKKLPSMKVSRAATFSIRQLEQEKAIPLPLLPTTTIGSFPQTADLRKRRQEWRKGQLSDVEYDKIIKSEIKRWVELQEEIGLDVLVHGEFERTDMVEFFGEKLAGFHFTKLGWVQSYGSRCVKPPIIFGDVTFESPMTLKETLYAQSLTDKPVKGMLTGPVTILNWSFVREDISRFQVANQIAIALRKEVEVLEENGISMIQVDEPALREGLPLKPKHQEEYLDRAVYAFKLATSSVKNETQIHTHMCYSNFKQIINAIDALDADVISIETSRSHGELIQAFEEETYGKGIGLGIYDIHSPRVPTLGEMMKNIERALQVLDKKLFWINPDCGLKTRGEAETIAALKVMIEAARQTRERLLVKER